MNLSGFDGIWSVCSKTKLHSQQKWQSIVSADPHHQSNVI